MKVNNNTDKIFDINDQENEHNNNKIIENDGQNNQHQLEILACDETLQDFEKYLLDRGFDEMIECVVSKNTNERQNFSYFFKYFGMNTDINNQCQTESNILFILNLKHILTTLNNENYTDKKQQLLAIIAVALQNCKLRESFFPEGGNDNKIGNNLLSLLSQAQYFLRLARKCKVSFSSRNVCNNTFLKQNYKEIDVIDSNNFLYRTPYMMPLVSREEIEDEIKKILEQQQTRLSVLKQDFEKNEKDILSYTQNIKNTNIDETTFNTHRNSAISNIVNRDDRFVNKHFKKISTAILEFANTKSQNTNTEIIVPTSYHWGSKQNSFIINQYIQNINKINNKNISLTINSSDINHLTIANENGNLFKNNTINLYSKNNNTLFNLKPNNTIFYQTPTTFPDNAIYINSGDHLVFPSNEGHIDCRNKLNANNNKGVNYQSTDVAMINTEFFKFLGADGELNRGIFTFNNQKNAKQNFQSLNMPNIFKFKGENIDAIKFVSELCSNISEDNTKSLQEQAFTLCEKKFPKLTEPKPHWYDPRSWCSCINGANDSLEQESRNALNIP